MKELLELVRHRAMAETGGLLFARRGSGVLVAIDYHLNTVPSRKPLEDLAPFCLIAPLNGVAGERLRRKVTVIYCLYNENRDQALVDLDTLGKAVFELSHPGKWTPWVLEKMVDHYGVDEDSGSQPHPQYYYTATLDFVAAQTKRHKPWRG